MKPSLPLQPPDSAPARINKAIPPDRRGFLGAAVAAILGFFMGGKARAQTAAGPAPDDAIERQGGPLTRFMRRGTVQPLTLDSLVCLERGDEHLQPSGTHSILALVQEERGATRAFPWTLFGSLVTHHESGDAVVLQSRLHKHGAGWSAGIHSEAFCHGRGVTIGLNIEMHNDFAGPEGTDVIGLNIQATEGPTEMKCGVQIQDAAGLFRAGVLLDGKGSRGIDLAGQYEVGLDLRDNPVRLNEGACIELDSAGKIRLRYRNGRIEFLNGDKCFGHLDVDGEDHAL